MGAKIGERQRWAWLASGLSAAAAANVCGFSWLWVFLGGLAITVYYIILDRTLDSTGLAAQFRTSFGRGGRVLAFLTLLWTILIMSWTACLADTAFPMVDGFPGLGWVLLALAAWGSKKGPGACARCCGVLCLFLIVLYGVVAIFAVPDVQGWYLLPDSQWEYSLWTAGLFLLPAGVWYVPCTRSKKGPAWRIALFLPVGAAVLAAVTVGVLSPELAASRAVPLYDLAQSVSVFGVMERIEPLLSAAMTMGVFALLSSLTCAAQALADQVMPWQWNAVASCVLAGILMGAARNLPIGVMTVGAGVFWMVLPILSMWIGKRKREKGVDKRGKA